MELDLIKRYSVSDAVRKAKGPSIAERCRGIPTQDHDTYRPASVTA
jgi:hypothetical protein